MNALKRDVLIVSIFSMFLLGVFYSIFVALSVSENTMVAPGQVWSRVSANPFVVDTVTVVVLEKKEGWVKYIRKEYYNGPQTEKYWFTGEKRGFRDIYEFTGEYLFGEPEP